MKKGTRGSTTESCFLRMTDVMRRIGFKRTQIYQMIKEGRFPASISIGPRAVAWDSDEIDEWMEEQRIKSRKN